MSAGDATIGSEAVGSETLGDATLRDQTTRPTRRRASMTAMVPSAGGDASSHLVTGSAQGTRTRSLHPRRVLASARRLAEACGLGTAQIPDRHAAEVRAQQLSETLQLVSISAVTHIAVAATFVVLFWSTPQRLYVSIALAAITVPSLVAVAAARFRGRIAGNERWVDFGLNLATTLAGLIGLAWGTMPIALFAPSDPDHRMIVIATAAGLVADVYALGPSLMVCLAYVFPVILGSFIGINWNGDLVGLQLSALLTVYGLFVLFSSQGLNRLSLQRIVDGVRISEQNDTIGLLLRDFEETTSDWLWEIDEAGNLIHVSDSVAEVVGLPVVALDNLPFAALFAGGDRRKGADAVLTQIAARKPFHDQIVDVETSHGTVVWRLTGKPTYDKQGAFSGYRGVGSDVTTERNAEARIAHMACHDELTGLRNRAHFVDAADHACETAATDRQKRALLYLDLDGFKAINDTYGHAIGDELLAQVSRRIVAASPNEGIAGRLGGDEFALLFDTKDVGSAETIASGIINAISMPYDIGETRMEIGVSIGLAITPDDSDRSDGLLFKADLALYRAKADGRGCYRTYVHAFETSIVEQRALQNDLRVAIARGEFALHYQPIVDLKDGRITCMEALLRWQSPTRGTVSPIVFIPLAEATGLITTIGQWVLRSACRTAALWCDEIKVAINISPQHFKSPRFVDDVLVALELSGLPPRRLEVEITEGVFLDNCKTAIANLHELRRRGVSVALDDFGTGFSSLNYLVNFPVDRIKIDRSFICDLVERRENRAIVRAILTLARELKIKVTAEGVETVEQINALQAQHCDEVQGFFVSRPLPAGCLDDLFSAKSMLSLDPAPTQGPIGAVLEANSFAVAVRSTIS